MRSSAHFHGHPIHPMLIPFPFAYLFGAAAVDLYARAANQPKWAQTAKHMRTLGIGSALAAAVPGLIDYVFAIPPRSSASNRATKHMAANLSAVGLFVAARAAKDNGGAQRPAWTIAAEMCGAALLAAGGWMGGTLVFRNQIAVDHRYPEAGKWEPLSLPPAEGTHQPIDLGPADQLEIDQMKLVRLGTRRLALARTADGYVAFDDRCTHRGGPLSDGTLACGTVQCPWHGSQFDVRTGEVRAGPAKQPIASYRVDVADSQVRLVL